MPFHMGGILTFTAGNPKPHLALGFGEHLCMGTHLAKIQVQLTVESLVRRFPNLALVVPGSDVSWPPWTFMRMAESDRSHGDSRCQLEGAILSLSAPVDPSG